MFQRIGTKPLHSSYLTSAFELHKSFSILCDEPITIPVPIFSTKSPTASQNYNRIFFSKFEININSLKIDFIQKRVLSYYKIKLIDQLKSIVIKFFIFFKNNFLILENEEVKI